MAISTVKDCADIMFDKFYESGETLNNVIIQSDFSDLTGVIQYNPVSSFVSTGNGIGVASIDGSGSVNTIVQFKDLQEKGHVYYRSIVVKTSSVGASVVLYNNDTSTPGHTNVNKRVIPNDGEWHTFSWFTQNSGDSITMYMTIGYSGDGVGEIHVKEPLSIDLTSDLGLNFNFTVCQLCGIGQIITFR